MPSTSRPAPSRYEMSGRTRSMPSMSSCGNISPASTTRILFSHSRAHMLMPTSPRPPSGRYRRRLTATGSPRTRAAGSEFVGCSQQAQLLCFLLRSGLRLRRWWRGEELVEVLPHAVEVVLEVRHERPVVQRRSGVVQRDVSDVAPEDQAAMDARDRTLPGQQPLEGV